MTDKVQKIREEVERLKEETSIGLSEHENGVEHGRMEILNALSIFLDSMQEEPQVKESAKVQHVNETCKENGNSLTKEPVSEELEEAINQSFIYHENRGDNFRSDKQIETAYRYGFESGANWKKEQIMSKAIDGEWFRCGIVLPSKYYADDVKKVKIIVIKED